MKKSAPPMPITAMSARPVARPSSPSMRLKALIAPTIQNSVKQRSSQAGIQDMTGSARKPMSHQKKTPSATPTCPASFTSGGSPNLSSSRPTTTSAPVRTIRRWRMSLETSGESCEPVTCM